MSDDDKMSFLDQPRDDKGRFATSDAQAAAAPAVAPAPEPTAPPAPTAEPPTTDTSSPAPAATPATQPAIPPGYIPLAAQLDEREKRQAAERERDELKRRWEEIQRQQQQQQQPLDPLDTEGFERALNERFGDFEWKTRTAISHSFAVKTHGADAVKAAEEWLQQTHAIPLNVLKRQHDPYDFAVRAHKKELRDQELGDDADIATIIEKHAAKYGFVKAPGQQPSNASAPPSTAALPPPSLASAPAAGGKAPTVPTGPGTAHGALFK
jgi:hypothetical protein